MLITSALDPVADVPPVVISMVWAQQQLKGFDVMLPSISSYPSVEVLAGEVAQSLAQVKQATGKSPKVMVMGAKGSFTAQSLRMLILPC